MERGIQNSVVRIWKTAVPEVPGKNKIAAFFIDGTMDSVTEKARTPESEFEDLGLCFILNSDSWILNSRVEQSFIF